MTPDTGGGKFGGGRIIGGGRLTPGFGGENAEINYITRNNETS